MTSLRLLPESLPDRDEHELSRGPGFLTCERGNLPLVAMTVTADITGLLAAMTIRQTFTNPHHDPIEASYIFPLPDRAAVTALTVTIGSRRITGRIQERQAGRAAYDAALAAGQRAALLEEDRPDVFTTRIGNLAPGEQAVVELTLAGPVAWEFDEATFRVPLVVAPRYIPGHPLDGASAGSGTALDTDVVPDASRITPPILLPGSANSVRLAVRVRLDPGGLAVSDLRSSRHAVVVAGELPAPVTIELQPGERLNRDFILRYRAAGDDGHRLTALAIPDDDASGEDEGTYLVTVLPPSAPTTAPPRDVVLLLDRSGSMGGWKMAAARRAAARIVDSLTSADRFTVLAFDDRVERPSGLAADTLVEGSDRNRYRAVEWLSHLEARGGTELGAALRDATALGRDGGQGRTRCCVLVTDGQVGNEDQLVRLAADAGVTMFTVGIDQAVNGGLLRRLADITGGRCDLVESENRLDGVLADLERRIGRPVLESLTVRFEGLATQPGTRTPSRPAGLYPGVPLVLSGRFRGRPGGRATVSAADGTTMSCDVVAATSAAASAVWARAHLRDLEDAYAARPHVLGGGEEHEELAARIVAVSLRHRVLCRFTAWVAVDASGDRVEGAPLHRIVQPVEAPAGWAGPGSTAVFATARPLSAYPDSGHDVATAPPVPYNPQPAPGHPIPSPRAAGRRAAGRRAAGRAQPERHLSGAEESEATTSAVPYDLRLDELLAAVEAMDDRTTARYRRRRGAEARLLARDIASKVEASPLVGLLEALAGALDRGDAEAIGVALRQLRQAHPSTPRPVSKPRTRLFWR